MFPPAVANQGGPPIDNRGDAVIKGFMFCKLMPKRVEACIKQCEVNNRIEKLTGR
jgi:hypothetical protein